MAKIVIVDLISSTLIGELRDNNLVNYFYAVHGRDAKGNHAVQLIPPVVAGLTSACVAKDTFDKYGPACLEGIDAIQGQIFEVSDVTGRDLLFTYYDMRYGVYGIPNLMVSDIEKGKVGKLTVDG